MIVVGAALTGLALGLAYFAALRISLRRLDRPRMLAAAALARLGVAALVFWAVAQAGAAALLAALAGFLAGRWLSLRRNRP